MKKARRRPESTPLDPKFFLHFPNSFKALLIVFPLHFFALFLDFFTLFLFFSLFLFPPAPAVPQFFCPWSTVQCYCQLCLRTQEGHHLVTRRLSQMPLQGDLATAVVAFGISRVNMCQRCLSPTHNKDTQNPCFLTGDIFYNVMIRYS